MAVFSRQVASATRLIAKYGELVKWQQTTYTQPSETPWKQTESTPVQTNVSIVFLPVTRIGGETLRHMKGSEVSAGGMKGLMAANGFTPSIKDTVLRGSKLLRISTLTELNPNGESILWEIEFAA